MKKSTFTIKPILVIAILGLVISAACNSTKEKPHRDNKIVRISIAKSEGLHSPHVALSIDSSLNYFFQEFDSWSDTSKVLYSRVSRGFWDTVNSKVESLPSNQLDSSHYGKCDDCSAFELLITYKNTTKHILYKSDGIAPAKIDAFFYWLCNSYKKMRLTPCLEVLPAGKGLPSPMPLANQLKVPPRNVHNSKHRHKKK